MTRRTLLGAFLGFVTGAALSLRAATRGLGYVDVERAVAEGWFPCTVYLDGIEVEECVAFNDREGWVEANVLDGDGRAQYDIYRDTVLKERRYGTVTMVANTSPKPSKS